MGKAAPHTELEYLVLAMVGEGVNSGYAMRKEMNRMRGGRWSGESNSVYRIIRKLEKSQLILEIGKAGLVNRARTEYALTPQGDAFLHSWLTLPPSRTEVACLVDSLRTRSYFLGRLDPEEQVSIINGWITENRRFVSDLRRDIESLAGQDPDGARILAYTNLLYLGQARHEWLRYLRAHLKHGPAPAADPDLLKR